MKKSIFTHAAFIAVILAISAIYFMPLLQGKALPQGDLQKYEGMAKAQKDYHQATGDYSTWCPSMFGGMPGYQQGDPGHPDRLSGARTGGKILPGHRNREIFQECSIRAGHQSRPREDH